jgi:uncharacterized protein (TIGR02246 family)
MKTTLVLGVALLFSCNSSQEPPGSEDSEMPKAAADALTVFTDAWNSAAAGDSAAPQAYGTLYWPDAELVDPTGRIWPDQHGIVEMHVELWNTAFKGSVINGTVRRIRGLSPTLMIADLDLALKLSGPTPPGILVTDGTVHAHLKHVMEKRNGEWKVLAAQNTFYSP